MKIIGKDNHNRESVAEFVWLDGILPGEARLARKVCGKLNSDLGDGPGTYFVVEEDSYRLWRGMEELV